jgi:peroxiredoxin
VPGIGDPAPQFSAVDVIDGQTHALSDYAGQVVLLIFSGPSWCAPCQFEAPVLEELWQTFKGSFNIPRVQLLMVSCFANEAPPAFKQAVQGFGLTFPALLNPNQTITNLYGVNAAPTLFVIDTEQKICAMKVGISPPAETEYEELYGLLIGCGAAEPKRPLLDLSRWRAIVTILFGVTQDGGGLVLTPGGKPLPIDPWGPLLRMAPEKRDLYTNLAIAELTTSLRDDAAAGEIRAAALRSAEGAMRTIVAKGTAQAPLAGKTFELRGKKR